MYNPPPSLDIRLVRLQQRKPKSNFLVVGKKSIDLLRSYCAGAISTSPAMRIAYHRGHLAAKLAKSKDFMGSMLAVASSEEDVISIINTSVDHQHNTDIAIGCINSPKSVTITGSRYHLERLKSRLDKEGIPSRFLGVSVAYHSQQMNEVAAEYSAVLQNLERGKSITLTPEIYSSLTGAKISASQLQNAEYWECNMTSPVKFSDALEQMPTQTSHRSGDDARSSFQTGSAVDVVIEVGPRGTLGKSLKDVAASISSTLNVEYNAIMEWGTSALCTSLRALGYLRCLGCRVNLDAMEDLQAVSRAKANLLTDLPPYAFNHSRTYWHESNISKGLRFRQHPRFALLGAPVPDWNPLEPRWRNLLTLAELPWLEDHKVLKTSFQLSRC